MALNVSMTGTGTIGDIAPGWSVNEFATGVTIGETSAGTGTTSFSAKANSDSLLVINNDVTSNPNELGNVTGVVQSVSQTGLNASVTHGSFLDKFNLDVDIPPVDVGGPYKWFYSLGKEVFGSGTARPNYGYPGTTYKNNFFPETSISAPSYSFPFDGESTDITDSYSIDQVFSTSTRLWTGQFQGYAYEATLNTGEWLTYDATDSIAIDGMNFSVSRTGSSPTSDKRYNRLYLQFSAMVDSSTRIYFGNKFGNGPSAPTYFDCIAVDINGATDFISITRMETELSETASIASLDKSQPIMFTLVFGGNLTGWAGPATVFADATLTATDFSGASVTTSGIAVQAFAATWRIVYDSINTSYMGFVNMGSTTSTVPTTYITPEPAAGYNYDIDFSGYTQDYVGAYPATSGIAWELMQQIAAAENFEISLLQNTIVVRDIGTRSINLTNIAASPTINPQSTLSGKQINIPYSDARFVSGVVYDARADGNNVISVNAGETTITSVKFDVNPITLKQPARYLATAGTNGPIFDGPLPEGHYFVVDSTGLPIAENQWEDYGASINVAIDPEDNSAIQVTLKGPSIEIPSTTGPYSLEANDGASSFAALNIIGTGVYTGSNVLQLLTGVDSEKYTRATVNTINNPFITTEEKAYDRGIWAALKAAGPVVTMNASIPVSSISGIGLTCGSLINYRNSTYRILSSSINALSVSILAEFYTTVNNVSFSWGSSDVGYYDSLWGSYECQDQIIFPYLHSQVPFI